MIRTYKLSLKANEIKLNKIKKLLKEYRETAKTVLDIQLKLFFKAIFHRSII